MQRLPAILIFILTCWVANLAFAAEPDSYQLGPDDQITIRVLQAPELAEKPVRIDMNGYIDLPFVGRVHAGGLTIEGLRKELITQLGSIIRDPQVSVSVEEFRSQPVSVMGAVNTPGVLQLRGHKTLIEMLTMAGGLRQDSGTFVNITRDQKWGPLPLPGAKNDATGHYSTASVDLKLLMEAKDPSQNIVVRPDDVITVPRAQMVYVIGEVQKTGGYVLNDRENMSLLEALSLAGGVNRTASPQHARILRARSGSEREEIPVDLNKIFEGKGSDIELRAQDILFIPSSMSKRASVRALEAAIQVGTGLVIWRR
ncbi:MAG: polysaccharide biosynthesis/export family protein [Bryobacteraceae bacterium]